jgi:two-component system chemotaxis response regulator CheB
MASPPTRVLLVDDSAVVRKLLADALRAEPDIEVIGGAADPYIARDMILLHKPDLITLDIEMPRLDGLSFLKRLMEFHPVPAIVISSVTQSGSTATVEALRLGALGVITKPGGPRSVTQVADELKRLIRAFRQSPPRLRPAAPLAAPVASPEAQPAERIRRARGLIAIGASTGGTQAIEALLTRLPADLPPIVMAQHMPAGYTRSFADRLNRLCKMRVIEAVGTETLERGTAYLAPGDSHLTVEAIGTQLLARLDRGPKLHYQRPAVDALFNSIARLRGVPVVALLLTGMGSDGADGMVALRNAGATTIAEAEESCIVFGMPKQAIARGGAVHVATLWAMPQLLVECLDRPAESRVMSS